MFSCKVVDDSWRGSSFIFMWLEILQEAVLGWCMCFSVHHITFTSLHVNIHYHCHKRSAVYPNANIQILTRNTAKNSSGQNTIRKNWHSSQPLKTRESSVGGLLYSELSNEYACALQWIPVNIHHVQVQSFHSVGLLGKGPFIKWSIQESCE